MLHKIIAVGPFQCNCSILACERTQEAIVIDPGDEGSKILAFIHEKKLKVRYILHTHAHLDHIGASSELHADLQAPLALHQLDNPLYENLPAQGRYFGFEYSAPTPIHQFISDNETLRFGDQELQILHTPGHSPGGVCFKIEKKLFSGDSLFRDSIGRTDLWGADFKTLIRSIKERLFVMDEETLVHPGHGLNTSIGHEKAHNPFLR